MEEWKENEGGNSEYRSGIIMPKMPKMSKMLRVTGYELRVHASSTL